MHNFWQIFTFQTKSFRDHYRNVSIKGSISDGIKVFEFRLTVEVNKKRPIFALRKKHSRIKFLLKYLIRINEQYSLFSQIFRTTIFRIG